MKSKRIPSIRTGLARLVAACLIPAIVVIALFFYADYQRSRQRLVHDSIEAARAVMLAVDGEFLGAERTLRALSTSPFIAISQRCRALDVKRSEVLASNKGRG